MSVKSFYIKTFGCKLNQYESQVIRENFIRSGYVETEDINEADICVVNTCTVTSRSDTKSLHFIRHVCRNKKGGVIVTGCMTEIQDLDLLCLKGVDYIIRNRDKYRITELIDSGSINQARGYVSGISYFKGHNKAFVKIQDGCNNMCSYCKVRVVRGRSRSRPINEILEECETLIQNGYKEIILTGICLGSYGKDLQPDLNLSKLIERLCEIKGKWRLRLSSIEPGDIDGELIEHFQSEERLCKHLHIPFQSGDDYILNKMNRPYKRRDYLNLVKRLRSTIRDLALSTDIMVGFPGETNESFMHTFEFLKMVRPMRMHIFPFSKRIGTKAYKYGGNISENVKAQRRDKLQSLAHTLSREFIDRFAGRVVSVLVEDRKSTEGLLQGYTDRYIKVFLRGSETLKGQLLNCLITLTNPEVYGIVIKHVI